MKNKKIGGLLVSLQEVDDSALCVNSCELNEICFKGIPYTWWKGRLGSYCIFERLDKIFSNASFQK